MKGFLNKVSGGGKPSTTKTDVVAGAGPAAEITPRADIALPKGGSAKRRSSNARNHKMQVVKELPLLSETPMLKREALFKQKLQLCCILFDFEDPESDARGKELKRETLVELAEYVNTPAGQKIFTESLMPDIVQMVKVNLLRTLPPQTDDFDPEEDEPAMEAMWPHLQVVYEFFLRFIVSSEVNGKVAKRYVDQAFIRSWIELFDAEDPRERDYVKTVLHRMYGKFMSYRSSIRKVISQVFFQYIYETGRHNGIAELLEILGSIINGFAIPLKREHIQFLEKALIPLHKPRGVAIYHPQLSYCISQYVEKDQETIVPIVNGLVRFWPWTSAAKQVLFLNELEEVLELCRGEQLLQVQDNLYRLLAACLGSTHFQVAERALYYWNSEHLCVNVLSQSKASIFLPYVFGPLSKSAAGHWNQAVEGLAQSILKMYMDMGIQLYEKCSRENNEKTREAEAEKEASAKKWSIIIESATNNGIDVSKLL
ncbi:protein phosphatase 2A regulatory B subunit [Ochromonadaceae sp. CCMP2298]|nr:protein phosphatase 2A regulatory B subunit [Ochromonadaceae sp. CCMP2298]